MGRSLFALIAACGAVLLVGLRSGAASTVAAAEPFAPMAGELRPAGTLRVDGRTVEASTFTTSAPVAEVIAGHRAAFENAPVDLAEQELGEGRVLSILDVRNGRHVVVAARSVAGRTEVVRGWSPLGGAPPPGDHGLPDGWILVSTVEDRLGDVRVLHRTALAPAETGAAGSTLAGHLASGGWQRAAAHVFRFTRGGETLEATFQAGPVGTAVQLLQREEIAP